MRSLALIIPLIPLFLQAQPDFSFEVEEKENTLFRKDPYWRGADGAASIPLGPDRILWLFSDTFIDQDGTGKRANARHMVRNSLAIQTGNSLEGELTFYYRGTPQEPRDFFEMPGEDWFWTGHGTFLKDKLVIFLMEEAVVTTGLGFEAVGWHVALIDNPWDSPDEWNIRYVEGPETFGVVVGSSAVLEDKKYVYTFGVKEPSTHETYLLRFRKKDLLKGNLSLLEWWVNGKWTASVKEEPVSSSLFESATEFSVHYDRTLKKYVQIQTFGFGHAQLGFRTSGKLEGPWSEPQIFYTPPINHPGEFVYTANAHPELKGSGAMIVTYNVNNEDFDTLFKDESIYFPRIIKVEIFK